MRSSLRRSSRHNGRRTPWPRALALEHLEDRVLLSDGLLPPELAGEPPTEAPEVVTTPSLDWSTYLGGGEAEEGSAVAADADGNVVVTGFTGSADYPTSVGLDTELGGVDDAFVTKFSPSGAMLWSTYLGGGGSDRGEAIALDAAGNVWVTGETAASDFPVVGGFDTSFDGGSEAFLAKLDSAGALVWSSYLGGDGYDGGYAIALAANGDVVVTGQTDSTNFDSTDGFDAALGGTMDAFVTRVSSAGALVWSSYLGGDNWDWGRGITIDGNGDVVVTGETWSGDFPSGGGFDAGLDGENDAFVTKISGAGALLWSSYLGGTNRDIGKDVATGADDSIYLVGQTASSDFPAFGAFDTDWNDGGQDGFITKISASGVVQWSSYVGGDNWDALRGVDIDASGRVFVVGETGSGDFPIVGGFDTALGGTQDAVAMKWTGAGAVTWSSYLGGSDMDHGWDLAVDSLGGLALTGSAQSTDFPTPGGDDITLGGFIDAFVTRIDAREPGIYGSKWFDNDEDGEWDEGEAGLAGWTIYLDSNDNEQLDGGEPSTTTDAYGHYAFTGLGPGSYSVREVIPAGWLQTYPGASTPQSRLFATDITTDEIVELDPATYTELNRFSAPTPVDGPDGLTFDGTSLFFLVDSSDVLYELNPDNGDVLDSDPIVAGSGSFDGLAALGGKIYILDHGTSDILTFDPVADAVTATLDIDSANPGVHTVGGLAAVTGPDALIVTEMSGINVLEIDPVTGAVVDSFAPGLGLHDGVAVVDGRILLGGPGGINVFSRDGVFQGTTTPPFAVSALGAHDVAGPPPSPRFFSTDMDTDEIVELNPTTYAEINRFSAPTPVDGPEGLAFDGTSLFFLADATDVLYELNPDTGAPIDSAAITDGSGDFDGLAVLGSHVYILDHGAQDIHKYDPATDTVIDTLDLDAVNPGINPIGGLAAITGPDALIVTDDFGATIHEIDPATGWVTSSFTPGRGPYKGVAVVDGQILLGGLDAPLVTNVIDVFSRDGVFQNTTTLLFGVSALGAHDVDGAPQPGLLYALRAEDVPDLSVIERIDPVTGAVLNSFTVPAPLEGGIWSQGLAVGPDSLFYMDSSGPMPPTLYELDLVTGDVVDSDVVNPPWLQQMAGLAYLDGLVYVELTTTDELLVWDPDLDLIVTTFAVAADLQGGLTGAADRGLLYDSNGLGEIVAIDPSDGSVEATLVPGVGALDGGLAYYDGYLYAADAAAAPRVDRIDPDTGIALDYFTLVAGGTLTGLGGDGVLLSSADGSHQVVLGADTVVDGVDFGNVGSAGSIEGVKWHDLNADGVHDAGEPGLAGWTIYLDMNQNGQFDAGEPSSVTDVDGNYAITGVLAGSYTVAEVPQADWVQTAPGDGRLFAVPEDATDSIVELDPATGDELNRFSAPAITDPPGLAFDGRSLFLTVGDTLWELDPDHGTVRDTDLVPGGVYPLGGLAALGGFVYILDDIADDIIVFDPVSDTVDHVWDVDALNSGVDLAGGMAAMTGPDALIVTENFGTNILEIDPSTGLITGSFDPASSDPYEGVAVLGQQIYLAVGPTGEIDVFSRGGVFQTTLSTGYPVGALGADGLRLPGTHHVSVTPGQVASGVDFGNMQLGDIHGTKWNDLDGNGQQDPGEPGLEGWTIFIDANGNGQLDAGELSTLTDVDGNYALEVPAGTHTVAEVLPAGWEVTYPGAGGPQRLFASISDPSSLIVELDPITGAEVNQFAAPETVTMTSGLAFDGTSLFFVADSHTMYELDPNTGDELDSDLLSWPGGAFGGMAALNGQIYVTRFGFNDILVFDPVSDTITGVLDVGALYPGYTLSGGLAAITAGADALIATVWDDADQNFVLEIDPASGVATNAFSFTPVFPIRNRNVAVIDGHIYINDVYITQFDVYSREGVLEQTLYPTHRPWALAGDDGASRDPSTAGTHTVHVLPGQTVADRDFGNVELGRIEGIKWHDLDGDGVRDAGEPGLPGWTVYLDLNGNGQLDAGEPETVTDADGLYVFDGLLSGGYHVAEVLPAGWVQTLPEGHADDRLFEYNFMLGDFAERDPFTGAELRRFEALVGAPGFDGLAFDGRSLFYLNSERDIWEVDPDTGARLAYHPLPTSANLAGMTALNGLLYVVDWDSTDILVFDPATDTIADVLDVDGLNPGLPWITGLQGLGAFHNPDVLLGAAGGYLLELDPATGLVTQWFNPGTSFAYDIVAGAENLIYAHDYGETQTDVFTRDGTFVETFAAPVRVRALEGGPTRPTDHFVALAPGQVVDTVDFGNATATVDLVGTSLDAEEPLRWGDTFVVDAIIANQGSVSAGSSTVRVYLSANGFISDADIELGSYAVGPIGGGGDESIVGWSLTLPGAPPAGFAWEGHAYIGIIVDADGDVAEDNEENNRNRGGGLDSDRVYIMPPASDLLATAFNAQEPLEWGATFLADVTVANQGLGASTNCWVRFYLSANDYISQFDHEVGSYLLGAVDPGGSAVIQGVSLTLPPAPPPGFALSGQAYLGVIVDADDALNEVDETNNRNQGLGLDQDRVWISTPAPDLAGTLFDAEEPLRWGDAFSVDGEVTNQGLGVAGASQVTFYLSTNSYISPSDVLLGTLGVGALASGETTGFSHTLTLPVDVPAGFDLAGYTYIGMIVDSAGAVTETDESNNANRGTDLDRDRVYIMAPAPDLVGTWFNSQEPLRWGETFHLDAEVTNQGQLASGAAAVRFYLSVNGYISPADELLAGDYALPALAAGATETISGWTLTLPVPPPAGFPDEGRVYIAMIVDADSQVAELDEDNNANQGSGQDMDPVYVLPAAPDLTGTGFDVPDAIAWGETIDISTTIENLGAAASAGCTVSIYLSINGYISAADIWLASFTLPTLDPGASFTSTDWQVTLPTDPPAGFDPTDEVYIGMIVDVNDEVFESEEGNNANLGTGLDMEQVSITPPSSAPEFAPEGDDWLAGLLEQDEALIGAADALFSDGLDPLEGLLLPA